MQEVYYVGLEHLDTDSLKIRRWGTPSDVKATKLIFRKGDIIFGRRRVYQRKVAVAEFDGICSAHALVLRAKSEIVLPEFLPFFMQSNLFMERAKAISVGSLSPTINWKTLAKEEFALPPIEEQRRMAKLLHSVKETDEKIQALEFQHNFLKLSLIEQRTQELTKVGITKLEQVVNRIESGKSPGGLGRAADEDEFGVLKVSAVGDWYYHSEENKAITETEYQSHLEVKPGDLLATRANVDPDSVGRTCLVRCTRPGLMLSDKT